jgi:hypothetical protein
MFWNPDVITSPLFWAANGQPVDLVMDAPVTLPGGTNIAIPGSPSSSLIAAYSSYAPQIQTLTALTRKPDILFVQSLQNDYMNTAALAAGFAANVTSFATQALALGIPMIAIVGRMPKTESGAADVPRAIYECNRILRNFCRDTRGCTFVDMLALLKDKSGTTENGATPSIPYTGTNGAAGGYSTDGTHPSRLGGYAARTAVTGLLTALGARMLASRVSEARDFDRVNFPGGNVLGRSGLMQGTGGTYNSVANTNVAGQAGGTWPDADTAWALADGSGVVATPTIVTGADGYLRQRLTFSGTATAQAVVSFSMSYFNVLPSGLWLPEALVDMNAVSGMLSWGWDCPPYPSTLGATYLGTDVSLLPPISGNFMLRGRRLLTSSTTGGTQTPKFQFIFAQGQTASGSVDIGRVGLFRSN